MALQYTDDVFVTQLQGSTTRPVMLVLDATLDVALSLVQILLSLFKLVIAAFLL